MLTGLHVQWEQVSIHDEGRIQEVWDQHDSGVSILRVMMIAEGGSEKSDLGVGMGYECVDYMSHSEASCVVVSSLLGV